MFREHIPQRASKRAVQPFFALISWHFDDVTHRDGWVFTTTDLDADERSLGKMEGYIAMLVASASMLLVALTSEVASIVESPLGLLPMVVTTAYVVVAFAHINNTAVERVT